MAEGKSRHDWSLISSLCSLVASANSSQGYGPADFNPWTRVDAPEADIADLIGGD